MNKLILVLLGLAINTLLIADNDLSQRLNALQTYQASVTQQNLTGNETTFLANGSILFQKPDQLLWHQVTPYEQIIALIDDKIWVYDLALEQVIIRPAELKNTPLELLFGVLNEQYNISQSFARDGYYWYLIDNLDTGAQLWLGFQEDLLRELHVYYDSDKQILLRFNQVVNNIAIDPQRFALNISRDADIITLNEDPE